MEGEELFNHHATKWMAEFGHPPGTDPLDATITRAKAQILRDVSIGRVPPTVRSFADLHDYVDANWYGGGFDWPVLPSETNDNAYQQAFADFWNHVQDTLSFWIASGEMRAAAEARGRSAGR